jgi:hypothetical protein
LGYRSLPKTQAHMPKLNREMATAAKGSGGSQTGTLCRWEDLTSTATTAAIATPKKIPRARFGCRCQAAPHSARNRTRPPSCSHSAITEKSNRWRDSWRLATTPADAPQRALGHCCPRRLGIRLGSESTLARRSLTYRHKSASGCARYPLSYPNAAKSRAVLLRRG